MTTMSISVRFSFSKVSHNFSILPGFEKLCETLDIPGPATLEMAHPVVLHSASALDMALPIMLLSSRQLLNTQI
jgi:hypothetical protein